MTLHEEVRMLRTLNDLLMGRVAELEDTAEELRLAREQLHEQRTLARHAYRRGYGTGYHTGRAGRPRRQPGFRQRHPG